MANSPTKRVKDKTKDFKIPPLTSLIDAVTIIMFFLMTLISTNAVMDPIVSALPKANSDVAATKGVVFGLDRNGLFLDKGTEAKVRKVQLADASAMGGAEKDLPALNAVLEEEKTKADRRKIPLPNLTVQIDSMISYSWVLKLVDAAGAMQYKKMDIIVVKAE